MEHFWCSIFFWPQSSAWVLAYDKLVLWMFHALLCSGFRCTCATGTSCQRHGFVDDRSGRYYRFPSGGHIRVQFSQMRKCLPAQGIHLGEQP